MDIFDIKVEEGSYSDPEDLKFTWSVSNFSGKEMALQLNFEKPMSVSSAPDKERLKISFKSEEIFSDVYQ